MTEKVIYNITLLNSVIIRDNATLLNTYDKMNRETSINFKCSCGIEHKKTFRLLESCGAFCKKCTTINSVKKVKQKKQEKITVETSIVSTHPDIAKYWHPTKNGDLKPEQFTKGSHILVWWLCPVKDECKCPHEYETIIYNRINQGCPYCSSKKICYHKSLASLHPEIAMQWHPNKNYREDAIEGEYFPGNQKSPSEISTGSSDAYWWLCTKANCKENCEHPWYTRVSVRTLENCGCPFCSGRQVCVHNSIVHTDPHIAKLFHPTKNNFSVETLSPKSNVKPWWLCPKKCNYGCLHEWQTSVYHLTTDTACPCCSGQKHCVHNKIPFTHPYLLSEWHPTKNDELSPNDISYKSHNKIWWQCLKNKKHIWETQIGIRTMGCGCPLCKNKTEAKLLDFIKKHYPDVFTQLKLETCKNINHLPFDFCIPSLKLIIELDGRQHFIHIKLFKNNVEESIQRDIYKMKQAEAEGYKIIRLFQEEVYDNDETWLETNLLPEIKSSDRNHMFISTIDELYDEHIRVYESGEEIMLDEE